MGGLGINCGVLIRFIRVSLQYAEIVVVKKDVFFQRKIAMAAVEVIPLEAARDAPYLT